VDWVVSDHMGTRRTPAEFLIPEKEGPGRSGKRDGMDVVATSLPQWDVFPE
jgi:hypothetical protein